MNPWVLKGIVLGAMVAMIAIRAPHGQRSRKVPVIRSARGALETALLTLVWIGFAVPIVWVWRPIFEGAEFETSWVAVGAGAALLAAGLWLFHRSHADLGTNWSITLEVRAGHRLVTNGVYRRIRHPMYSALLLYSVGQVLVVPNWIVAPTYLVPFALLVALRLGPEERLMREQFGKDWDAYAKRTKRLVPGVW
jgi:protein-S-isoprenylcysteine O-methyltransferase Ste14